LGEVGRCLAAAAGEAYECRVPPPGATPRTPTASRVRRRSWTSNSP